MNITVINPNSSAAMTDRIRRELIPLAAAGTRLEVVSPARGPAAIESATDEACAIPLLLSLAEEAAAGGADAVIIACFADPGLDAARELLSIPVVGLEEAALHVAAMLGHRFTILTARRTRVPAKYEHVARVRLERFLASVRPLDMGVLEMEEDPQRAAARLLEVGRAAVSEDGAEVLVLGCAGLAGHAEAVTRALGVAVVDPLPVALKTAEMLAGLGLRHSKRAFYALPPSRAARLPHDGA